MPDEPLFLETDVNVILAENIALFEEITGRPLQPAQVERLIVNMISYRETKLRQDIQDACLQGLVSFARAPFLDFLGELVGAFRLAASPASTTFDVILVTGHTGVTIPQGTRVSSPDGKAVFSTVEDVVVTAGVTTATVDANCTVDGTAGNGYGVGIVTNILDPQAYIVSMTNNIATAGGAEQEDDTAYRARIVLATAQFSTAGSINSYAFHALSANPGIIDVSVTSPAPGDVLVLPLMEDGSITPAQVITQVTTAVNAENVRPLTDTVTVAAPTQVLYALTLNVKYFSEFIGQDIPAKVQAAAQSYVDGKRQKLGQDILESQIKGATMLEGVYDIDLPGFVDLIIAETEYAYCNSIIVNDLGPVNE